MKKVLIGLISLLFVTVCFAGDITDVLGNQHDRIWKEMRDNWHNLATGGTLTNGLTISVGDLSVTTGDIDAVAGVISSYGYNSMVSSNKSTAVYMTQAGTLSPATGGGAGATTVTNTFAIPYIEAPAVTITQYELLGTNMTIVVSSNKFTVIGGDGWKTNGGWVAVGRVK